MIIPIVLIVFIILIVLIQYNSITKLKMKVKQSKSGIDVYLQQRFDLIPNLVQVVKGYMNYEKETLQKIIELRTQYNETKDLKKEITEFVAVDDSVKIYLLKLTNKLDKKNKRIRKSKSHTIGVTSFGKMARRLEILDKVLVLFGMRIGTYQTSEIDIQGDLIIGIKLTVYFIN